LRCAPGEFVGADGHATSEHVDDLHREVHPRRRRVERDAQIAHAWPNTQSESAVVNTNTTHTHTHDAARTKELGVVLGGEPHGDDLRVVPALLLDQVQIVLLLRSFACTTTDRWSAQKGSERAKEAKSESDGEQRAKANTGGYL
jgi:hypothetical protein